MQLYTVLCVLATLFFVSLPVEGGKKFDPSTIINVYPSLEALNKNGGAGGGIGGGSKIPGQMDDCDDASCAAASNTMQTFADSGNQDASKPADSTTLKKLGKKSDKSPGEPLAKNPKGDTTNWDAKPRNWNSFRDMLDLLRKKKH